MLERIIGVFKLDRNVFADIEHDQSALSQAAIVVAIVAALSAVGSLIGALFQLATGTTEGIGGSILGIVLSFVMVFVNWAIWSGVTFFVGTKLFNGEADFQEMMRVIGFAYAPQMLSIIPCIGPIVGGIWSLIASYIAIKEGLDLDDGQTIATVVVGWLVTMVIGVILGMLGLAGGIGVGLISGLFQ